MRADVDPADVVPIYLRGLQRTSEKALVEELRIGMDARKCRYECIFHRWIRSGSTNKQEMHLQHLDGPERGWCDSHERLQ